MRSFRIFFLALVILASGFGVISLANDSFRTENKIPRKFSLDYFVTSKNNVRYLITEINNGKLIINQNSRIENGIGKPILTQPLCQVYFFDNSNNTIDSTLINDPYYVRSCSKNNSIVHNMKNGSAYIPLPNNDSITKIKIVRSNNEELDLNVEKTLLLFLSK